MEDRQGKGFVKIISEKEAEEMFGKAFQRKYALTDQGVRNTKQGTFWTVIVNLVVMGGAGILYLTMSGFMGTLTEGYPLSGKLQKDDGSARWDRFDLARRLSAAPSPAARGRHSMHTNLYRNTFSTN